LGFVLGIISKPKAIAVNDVGLKEELRVEGLVDDRVGGFGNEICKQDWLLLMEKERKDRIPHGLCKSGGGTGGSTRWGLGKYHRWG
jgi:hypothetical protein